MAYKMTHPASDVEVEVNADQVAMYESQGWETSPNAKLPQRTAAARSSTTSTRRPRRQLHPAV